ncbi:putative FAS1 domain-containing protein [Dioscorea sansibarensis]
MSSSRSHWWHAPVYIAASIALVVAAISASGSTRLSPSPTADDALRRAGFHLTAAVLHLSPSPPLPSSRPATLFALPDPAFTNLSLTSAAALLQRHSLPVLLTLADLRRLPRGTCLSKELTISPPFSSNNSIAINGIPISHPDLYLSESHAIHGITAGFPNAACSGHAPPIPWSRVTRALESHGYVAFTVGLLTVLRAIEPTARTLDQVTIFAPQDIGFHQVTGSRAKLEGTIRRHVAIGRYDYPHLMSMKVGEEIRTMEKDVRLKITASGDTGMVMINRVQITEPEVYTVREAVVHGTPRCFGLATTGHLISC